jgi:ring-1,2-phenylacetyl-CoA epoxidase subunit PaaC
VGQARAVLTRAGAMEAELGGAAHDEDQLAFLRDERDFLNLTVVELPRGDFAVTVLRNFALATFLRLLWERLLELERRRARGDRRQGLEGSALPPAACRRLGAALGGGTDESLRRLRAAAETLWPYLPEMFDSDASTSHARSRRPRPALARPARTWRPSAAGAGGSRVPRRRAARSAAPASAAAREHMGYILAEMQHLQRSHREGLVRRARTRTHGRRKRADRAPHQAWQLLAGVLDPKCRSSRSRSRHRSRVRRAEGGLEVVLTPTYSAARRPSHRARRARRARDAGLRPGPRRCSARPAWTTDWISADGRRKLREYGIAPPGPARPEPGRDALRAASRGDRRLRCPRCDSANTERTVGVRLDRLQGAVPLPRLRRAVRALQADLGAR